MFWETSLIPTSIEKETYSKNGRVSAAVPRRKRAASTSLALATLCFNTEPLNLDSIFSYLPGTPRRFSRHSWSPPKVAARPAAPISSLPGELLCLIFDSYLCPSSDDSEPDTDDHPNGFFSVALDYIRTPLPLTHVCHQWRQAAIGHRRLWSNICLAFVGDELEIFAKGKIQLLRLFLLRARDTPLCIAFSASTSREDLVFEALQYICGYSHLWKELCLDLDRVRGAEMFADQLALVVSRGSNFNGLRSLHLELVVDDEEYEEEEALGSRLVIKDIYGILLRCAPNLIELSLDELFFVWAEGSDYFICPNYKFRCLDADTVGLVPWKQLKSLDITCESISTRKVLKVCSQAMNLESLKIWRVGCDGASEVDGLASDDTPSTQSSVALPHLRSLGLTLLTEPEQLLSSLSLPAVERIDVDVQTLRTRFPGPRSSSLESILAPINRIAGTAVDIHCKVGARCLEDAHEGGLIDVAWLEAKGLCALAGEGRRVIEVYK